MQAQQPRLISVLGDSISTFEGVSPEYDAYYTPDYASISKVYSVEDTWWMQVIRALGAELLVNNSHMGSSVARFGYQPASAPWRIEKLKRGATHPDLILIYSGLNDLASYTTPEEFGQHYRDMLRHAQGQFPAAALLCGTLCRGFPRSPTIPLFLNLDAPGFHPLSAYNREIRSAAAAQGSTLVDLAAREIPYSSVDGVHPDATGMRTLADLWIELLPETL